MARRADHQQWVALLRGVIRADDTPKPALGALTEAIAGRPPPAGLSLAEGCPEDRRAVDVGTHGSIVDDLFTRTATSGWGSADTGGAYTHGSGTDSNFAVNGGLGRMVVPAPGGGRVAVLGSVSSANVDAQVSFATDKAATDPDGQLVSLITRRIAQDSEYRVRVRLGSDAKVRLSIAKVVGGQVTQLGDEVLLPGVSDVPGAFINVRALVTGTSPTTIEAKAWAIGDAVPADWQLSETDSESILQAAGAVGLRADLTQPSLNGTVTFSFDDLHVSSPK